LTSVALIFALLPVGVALASECESPVEAVASQEPTLITILDTDVGTEAFERLVSYADGGHETLGRAIGQAHNWFGACEYVGVGIGYGSGGNGYRPNFTLALWRTGIDETTTRNAVYQLIGASQNPTVTTNDCTTSCTTSTPVTPETTTSPFVSAEQSSAECDSPSIAVASQEPTLITILDTDVGTEAFERLVSYADGGHETLGRAIGQAHNWFGACEYVGVGIGYGSGGNGYRPNFTLALWRTGIDETTTRNAVYQLIGASQNPTVTTNDCTTSCTTSTPVTPETTTSTTAPPVSAFNTVYFSTTDSVTSSKTTTATKPAAKKSPKTIVKRKSERSRKVAPKKSRVLR